MEIVPPPDPQDAAADIAAVEADLIEDAPEGPKINQPEPEPTVVVERGAKAPEPEKKPAEQPPEPEPDKVPEEAKVAPEPEKKLPTDEELSAELEGIQPRKGSHPNTAEAIRVLKEKVKAATTSLREATAKQEQLAKEKAELEARPLPPEVEEKIKNLEHFQRTFGIENDPEFTETYDKKIADLSTEAMEFMKSQDDPLPASVAKFIEDNGGPATVRYSQKLIRDPQNPEATITHEEWFVREILGNMDGMQKRKVEKMIERQLDLQEERNSKVADAKKNATAFIEQRQKQFTEQREAWAKEANKAKEEFMQALGPVASKVTIKDDMPKEEKERAEKHNAQVDYVNETFPKLLEDNTPRGRAAIAMSALQARYLTEYVQEVVPQLQKERDEFKKLYEQTKEFADKVKASGGTAKRTNAVAAAKKSDVPLHKVDDWSALKEIDKL